jgi:hypothetical protein
MGGDTPEEALAYGREAAELYLKSMVKHEDPIPVDLADPKAPRDGEDERQIVLSRVEEISFKF